MTRKNKLQLTIAIAIIAVIIVLGIWLMLPKSYESMIPAQAKAVLRITPSAEMMSESGKTIQSWIGIEPKGIDGTKPVYVFVTPNEYIGFAAAVSNEETLQQNLETLRKRQLATMLPESDGLQWAWIKKGWLLGWNSRAVLALGPGMANERDILRQTITQLSEGNDPFSSTQAWTQLLEEKGEAQLFTQVDALPAPYNALFRLNIPADAPLDAVQVFASLHMEKNKAQGHQDSRIALDFHTGSENADVKAQIAEYENSKGCLTIDEKNANVPLFYLATRMDGKNLVALLQSDATLRGLLMGLNQVVDANRLLGTANGLLSLEISAIDKDWQPTFALQAENATQNLLSDSDYWLECARKQRGTTLKQLSPTTFQLTNEKQSVCLGTLGESKGQRVFFASPSMLGNLNGAATLATRASGQNGLTAYFKVRMDLLKQQPCMKGESNVTSILTTLLPASKSLTYKAYTNGRGSIVIE